MKTTYEHFVCMITKTLTIYENRPSTKNRFFFFFWILITTKFWQPNVYINTSIHVCIIAVVIRYILCVCSSLVHLGWFMHVIGDLSTRCVLVISSHHHTSWLLQNTQMLDKQIPATETVWATTATTTAHKRYLKTKSILVLFCIQKNDMGKIFLEILATRFCYWKVPRSDTVADSLALSPNRMLYMLCFIVSLTKLKQNIPKNNRENSAYVIHILICERV